MANLDEIFGSIATAKPPGGFANKIGAGRHKVAITKCIVKDSSKGDGPFIEAEFEILESTTHQVGEIRGWAWFVTKPSFNGEGERGRNRLFVEAVQASLGDTSDLKVINAALCGPAQNGRGLVLYVEVTQAMNADNTPKLAKTSGSPIFNASWKPCQQTLADVAAMRAKLDSRAAATATPAQPQAQQPYGQPAPQGQPFGAPPAQSPFGAQVQTPFGAQPQPQSPFGAQVQAPWPGAPAPQQPPAAPGSPWGAPPPGTGGKPW